MYSQAILLAAGKLCKFSVLCHVTTRFGAIPTHQDRSGKFNLGCDYYEIIDGSYEGQVMMLQSKTKFSIAEIDEPVVTS